IRENEVRSEPFMLDGARIGIVAFGTSARVCKTAIQWARKAGIAVGMLRPVTLFPFPEDAVRNLSESVDALLVVEMNTGQMVEDVRQSTPHHEKIHFFGKPCAIPTPEEIFERIRALAERKR
ncbi:MAG: 3-methyl-2-oxobutanoate dehydrogenase subunit beta, partial [Verrucomicrobiota bacterium]